MTIEEAIKWLNVEASYIEEDIGNGKEILEAYDMAIKALEQQPCEDCISRESLRRKLQARHDFFINAYGGFSNLPQNDKPRVDEITNCTAMVVNEPSVTPQPKTGRWEWVQYDSNPNIGNWHCSECRTIVPYMPENAKHTPIRKWCPNCGAKMEVEE